MPFWALGFKDKLSDVPCSYLPATTRLRVANVVGLDLRRNRVAIQAIARQAKEEAELMRKLGSISADWEERFVQMERSDEIAHLLADAQPDAALAELVRGFQSLREAGNVPFVLPPEVALGHFSRLRRSQEAVHELLQSSAYVYFRLEPTIAVAVEFLLRTICAIC